MTAGPEDATQADTAATARRPPRAGLVTGAPVVVPERYRLLDVIGEGGMGKVYRAHDAVLGRDVAIKLIGEGGGFDKTEQRERFVREARAAARLVHPNIVAVHDVDADAGYIVMELVKGESLRDVLKRAPPSAALVRNVAEQVLSALEAAHKAGVIHRDIKPSNIMIDDAQKVTLVDFGVARLTDADLTKSGDTPGTPAYMAPEQLRGAVVDGRTDLYSLGATLYELVTATRIAAFEPPSGSALRRACGKERGLLRVVAGCLRTEPGDRIASATAALAMLRAPVSLVNRGALAGVGAAVVVACAAAAVLWSAREDRVAEAFTAAQRGENERASTILEGYLVEHPDDSDARALQFLATWWQSGAYDDRATLTKLAPAQRAMMHGIELITQRRETEAVAYLESALRDHPGAVEILYALGEARWHGQKLAEGADTLESAFALDPRWEMALHHVVEWHLTRGETKPLRAIAAKLRAVDAPAAAALDCKIAVGERDYRAAAQAALSALSDVKMRVPEVYICLAQAQALAGDLDASMATSKMAFELWPIDMREWGGFAQYAESFLYRGRFDEYLDLVRSKPSTQHTLATAYWQPQEKQQTTSPAGPGMRMPPLGAAAYVLVNWAQGIDVVDVYGGYPEPEVRAYGKALWAETRGDVAEAEREYRAALDAPQKGDMRMLVAHDLARLLYKRGDAEQAKRVCADVISPRVYEDYRAVLLPDCLLWSGDAGAKTLVDNWRGTFAHPAVVEARSRLAK